ncbi:MAG: regulatory protein, partial [Solirubrobacterales bacterium]|nr:regulatory protein [Solirubrobacterales bacterium]
AVPLTARGRILGVLSLVAATNARYDEDDLALAVELGRRAALAVDNARLFRAAHAEQRRSEEARATLDSYLEQAPVGFALFDDRLRFVRANAALAELDGIPAAEHAGRRAPELLGDVGDDVERLLKQVLTTGEVVSDVEVRGTLPAFPGRERQWLMSFYRVRLPGGDALGIGGTIVEVTERLRIEQALTGQRDLYETLLRAQSEMGEAFVLLEGAQAIYVNEAAERMTMRPAQELYDLPSLLELFPEPSHGGLDGYVRDVLARRPGVDGFETELVTPAGTRVAVELAAQPLEVDGRRRLVVVARDVSERRRQSIERERLLAAERRARRETEVAHERARMLAELSEVLDRSMELRRTLPEANRVLLRHGADVAGIDVVAREGQTVERMAVGAATPERDATQQLLVGSTYPLDSPNPWATVARTRKPLVTGDLAVDVIRGMAGSDAELDTLLQTAPRSVVFLPLVARGRTVGVMGLGWDASRKVPTGEERAHLEEVARRLATGIDNAQLYAERAHIASTLQAGLLPPALPDIPGIDAAARYLPAGEASEVGGDFYDLYPTTADRWAVVVGDVCGKGAEAAAVTAMARYTLRAATIAGPANPGNSLALLNAAMVTERIAERFLTAVLGELRLGDGHADLVLSCAGHPAPLIVRADGRIEPVEAHGALLGVAEGVTWEETELRLGRGDAIVLYTDGVTEADRRRPMEPGDLAAELLAAHPDGPPATAAALADAVRHVAEQRAQGPLRDDVAIVALRLV